MANFEVLSLDPTTPQIRAPGAGDGYSVPRDMTVASGANLTLSGGTANGVLYLNASKVATSGSAVTFNGTALAVGSSTANTNYLAVGGAVSVSNNYGTPLLSVASNSFTGVTVASHENTAASNGTYLGLMRSRGTQASPTNLLSGDLIGSLSGQVFNTAGANPYRASCAINLEADGNQASGDLPGRIVFGTVASGSTTVNERMRITSAGEVLAGTNAALSWEGVTGGAVQTARTTFNPVIASTFAASTAYPAFVLAKSRSGTVGTYTYPNSGDRLGTLSFAGANTSDAAFNGGALIEGVANQTWTSTAQGSYLRFHTTADGSKGTTERMRLDSSGNLGIGTASPGQKLEVAGNVRLSGSQVGSKIENRHNLIVVTTSATNILDNAGSFGRLVVVNGESGSNRFCDLVLASTSVSPTVVSSFTAQGSPAARTYTRNGVTLELAMASGTYNVWALALGY